jgi:hypothetical protein
MIHLHVWGGGMCCEFGSHVIHLCTFLVPTWIKGPFFQFMQVYHTFPLVKSPSSLFLLGLEPWVYILLQFWKSKIYIFTPISLECQHKNIFTWKEGGEIFASLKSWQLHYTCFDNEFYFLHNKRWVCMIVTMNIWLTEHTKQNITQEV